MDKLAFLIQTVNNMESCMEFIQIHSRLTDDAHVTHILTPRLIWPMTGDSWRQVIGLQHAFSGTLPPLEAVWHRTHRSYLLLSSNVLE